MTRIEQIQMLNALLEGDIKSATRRAELERELKALQDLGRPRNLERGQKVQLGDTVLKTVVDDDDALFWAEYAIEVLGQPRDTVTIWSE